MQVDKGPTVLPGKKNDSRGKQNQNSILTSDYDLRYIVPISQGKF